MIPRRPGGRSPRWPGLVLSAILALAVGQVAAAQGCQRADSTGWPSITWTPVDSIGLNTAALARIRDAREIEQVLAPVIVARMTEAADWLRAGGFPAPSLCTDAPLMLDFAADGADTAYYASQLGKIGVRGFRTGTAQDFLGLIQTEDGAGLAMGDYLDVVSSHELFHAVQEATVPIAQVTGQGGEWVIEGTANAVGAGFALSRGAPGQAVQVTAWRPSYDLPLHQPEADASSHHRLLRQAATPLFDYDSATPDASRRALAPYTRGHFFHHLGRDLGFEDGAGWLATDYTAAVADGVAGLRWLDGVLARRGQGGLAGYFPRFIARHAGDLNAYTTEALAEAGWVVTLRPGETPRTTRTVRPVAARPVAVELTLDAPDDLYWVEQRLDAGQVETLDMIVGDTVLGKGRAYGVLMGPGQGAWLTRVTNVRPRAPWTTAQEVFDLTLSATPVRVTTGCAAAGNTVELSVAANPDLDLAIADAVAAGRMRWRIDGGAQAGLLSVRVPPGVGKHPLYLEVSTQGGWRSFPVGTVEVRARGCMIRVETGDGAARITYVPGETPADDFSEITSPDGGGLYLREGEVQIFSPGAGWVVLPPDVKAALTEGVTLNPRDLLGRDGAEIAAAHASIHPALMMSETLSLAALEAAQRNLATTVFRNPKTGAILGRNEAGRRESTPLARAPVVCPNSNAQTCTRSDLDLGGFLAGEAIHDGQGRPVRVLVASRGDPASGQTFDFSYGLFDVTRPPGW